MAVGLSSLLLFFLAFVPARIFANKVDEEETCRRYANGQVYPEKTTISEHAVHWSKAQSKSNGSFHCIDLIPRVCIFKTYPKEKQKHCHIL